MKCCPINKSAAKAANKAKSYTVVLAGNPNAGKTTLYNALTHSRLRTGNFHGVTCSPAQKQLGAITYKDVPGMYSFNGYTMEEESSATAIASADLVINVVDATTLPTSISLTKAIVAKNSNTAVYLTKVDLLKRRGGCVNSLALQNILGVPVLDCRVMELKNFIQSRPNLSAKRSCDCNTQNSLDKAYVGGNLKISRTERMFYNRFFSLAFFFAVLIFTFFITFHPSMPGAYLKSLAENLLCVKLSSALSEKISNEVLRSLVCKGILGGVGGVLSFVPQISILYLCLIALDESGLSSVLSFITDGLFYKVGLSGRAAFSLVSGLGCTAAAISTTGGFGRESSRKKLVAALPYVPCGAKMPVFLTFLSPLFKNPFLPVCALYILGVTLSILISALLKGEREGLIQEIAPLSIPHFKNIAKKLYFQVSAFIIKVVTYVFIFCAISWALCNFSLRYGYCGSEQSIAGTFSKLVSPLFYPMGIHDWRIVYAALSGFAAKENIAATVSMLMPQGINLGVKPTLSLCVFFLCCPACVSAFAASVREVGLPQTLKYNLVQLAFAFAFSYFVYFILWLM